MPSKGFADWIGLCHEPAALVDQEAFKSDIPPLVVQVRGDRDPIVEEEDSLDIEGFLEGHQLLVMGAGHEDLILPNEDREFLEDKYNLLRQAILRPFSDSPGSMSIADSNKQIFFVMHGIRASNDDWVADVAGRITIR